MREPVWKEILRELRYAATVLVLTTFLLLVIFAFTSCAPAVEVAR